VLLRVHGVIAAALRTLDPRQFQQYQRMLQEVRSQARVRFIACSGTAVWPSFHAAAKMQKLNSYFPQTSLLREQ
jgi:hypothetical protein